ncbi:MAG: MATE family efflux transporter [Clostridia bacterium]|nr:MATE family efflux transporter [Clostridia bacterium]
MSGALRQLFNTKKRDVDMTAGGISGHLIRFAIPLLLGNILQQLYNMVDTWVVGNYVSGEAFSAVGTVGPIINLLVGFFMGLSSGAGVVVSQYYGAHREKDVRRTVHTAMAVTFIVGVVLSIIGVLMVPTMLDLIKTPAEVRDEAAVYLNTYFSGLLGLVVYNMGAGILRSVGDSQRPFYFLALCALANTVLDLVFVLAFDMGVFGVALATILSQGVSALLVVITLMQSKNCVRFSFRGLRIHGDVLGKIVKIGLPTALQMAITSFSNIFVQSYVNYFGTAAMGGWTAYAKIDQLVMLPMQSLSLACTTFVGQNLGNGDVTRAKRGVRVALAIACGATAVIIIPIVLFAPSLVIFFNDDPEIVSFGTLFLRWLTPFYILCCVNQIYAGVLRGAGKSAATMVITLASFVGFRQLYLFITANFISNTVIPIAMGYPAGWLLCSCLMFFYYRCVKLEKGRIVT